MKKTILALSFIASSLLSGCGYDVIPDAETSRQVTEQAVSGFHARFGRGDFKGIYAAAHPNMKAAVSEKDFVERLEAVSKKMGTVQATELPAFGCSVAIDARPVQIDADYKTKFSAGEMTERFTLLMEGKVALLADYQIENPVEKYKGVTLAQFNPGRLVCGPKPDNLTNKVVVVEFWGGHCSPCLAAVPHLCEIQKKYGRDKLVAVAVQAWDFEPYESLQRIFEKHAPKDYQVSVTHLGGFPGLDVQAVPVVFVLGQDGQMRWHGNTVDPEFDRTLATLLPEPPKP